MKTFQDLLAAGASEKDRATFCKSAVQDFMASAEYANAKAGQSYYDKHNITIEKYKKLIYTVTGRQIEDVYSANYKLSTEIFRRLCIQQVQYVLGNGVFLTNDNGDNVDKSALGKDIDFKLQKAGKIALAQGKAFGFWNLDHLEIFAYADTKNEPGFCPLPDENTAENRAGIRFWFNKVDNDSILKFTLFEEDGYTLYSIKNDEDPMILEPKRAYKQTTKTSNAMGIDEVCDENYATFAIYFFFFDFLTFCIELSAPILDNSASYAL